LIVDVLHKIGREFPYIFARKELFVGLSYFSIGMMMREMKGVAARIPVWLLAVFVVVICKIGKFEIY
jgi:hypothetical protein